MTFEEWAKQSNINLDDWKGKDEYGGLVDSYVKSTSGIDTTQSPTFMQSLNANAPAINAGVGAFNAGLGLMSYLDKKPVYKMQTALMGQQLEQNRQSAADRKTFNENWGKGLASSAVSAPRVG